MSCMAPDQPNKRICKRCAEVGFPGQEIIIEGKTILNLDGSKHFHHFDLGKWNWEHYSEDDKIEISKWKKTC